MNWHDSIGRKREQFSCSSASLPAKFVPLVGPLFPACSYPAAFSSHSSSSSSSPRTEPPRDAYPRICSDLCLLGSAHHHYPDSRLLVGVSKAKSCCSRWVAFAFIWSAVIDCWPEILLSARYACRNRDSIFLSLFSFLERDKKKAKKMDLNLLPFPCKRLAGSSSWVGNFSTRRFFCLCFKFFYLLAHDRRDFAGDEGQ